MFDNIFTNKRVMFDRAKFICPLMECLVNADRRPKEDSDHDASNFAMVVFNPKTKETGEFWPITWLGPVVFLEDPESGADKLLSDMNVVYNDMKKIKDFVLITKLNKEATMPKAVGYGSTRKKTTKKKVATKKKAAKKVTKVAKKATKKVAKKKTITRKKKA